MKQIAEEAGVSQATVSRVINGNPSVSSEKKQAVMEVVQRHSFTPNFFATGLAGKRSFLLGVIVPDLANPFFGEILNRIENEADHQGYNIILCNSEGDVAKERSHLNSLRRRNVEGILIAAAGPDSPIFRTLKSIGLPSVLFTQDHDDIDSVCVAHDKAGEIAAEHLLDLGHDRFAFLGNADDIKLLGFQRRLREHGLEVPRTSILPIEFWGDGIAQRAYEIGLRFFGDGNSSLPASAVFAYNDMAAFGLLHALQELHLRVPEDVAIVGFDNTFIARGTRPTLTSVAQPTEEIGRTALELLLKRIAGDTEGSPVRVNLEPRLVVRQSTRGVSL